MSSSKRFDGRFSTRILLPVVLVTAASIALAGFSLFWGLRQSDEVSVTRRLRTAERNIQALIDELAQQQEMVAVWNDTVEKLAERPLDLEWVDANLGPWLHRTFGQDQIYILDAKDEAIDATIDGKRVPVRSYALVRSAVENIVLGLRGRRFLATTGCTELQGHPFARPMPEERIAGLIAAHSRT
jgi:hypothetical protein